MTGFGKIYKVYEAESSLHVRQQKLKFCKHFYWSSSLCI